MSGSAVSRYQSVLRAFEMADARQVSLLISVSAASSALGVVCELPGDPLALLPGVSLPGSSLMLVSPGCDPFPATLLAVDRTGACSGFERLPAGEVQPSSPPLESLVVGMLRRCVGLSSELSVSWSVLEWAVSRWAQVFLDAAELLAADEFEAFFTDVVDLEPARLLSADCSAISWLLAEQLLEPTSVVSWAEARRAMISSAVLPPLAQVSAEWCDAPLFQMLHSRLVDADELRVAFARHPLPRSLAERFWVRYEQLLSVC